MYFSQAPKIGVAHIHNDQSSIDKEFILKSLLMEDNNPQHYEHMQDKRSALIIIKIGILTNYSSSMTFILAEQDV
jgi:hypothetical protein